jgi:hypothetical protein
MTTTTYPADRTALLIVDPYNDLPTVAVEFQLGDRHVGGSKPDHQRWDTTDAVVGGAPGGG